MSSHLRQAWAARRTAAAIKAEESPLDYHGHHPKRLAIYEDGFTGTQQYTEDVPGLAAFLDYDDSPEVHIHYLFVDDARQGKGLGRKLVQHLYDTTSGWVDWGEVYDEHAGTLWQSFREKHPDRGNSGKVYY
jgi:GNAT superfamily N-acetyltransferase